MENLFLRHAEKARQDVLKGLSFQLCRGEVVGIFGLMGAGRTELLESLFGLHPKLLRGRIVLEEQDCHFESPAGAMKAGLALVPEDRKKDGLVLGLDVRSNISLTTLEDLENAGLLHQGREVRLSDKYIKELCIKTSSDKQLVRNLSGGNQQKIVLAKWLATKPKVLLLDEPTRGIDINAKNEIYKLILQLADDRAGHYGGLVGAARNPGPFRPGAGDGRRPPDGRICHRRRHRKHDSKGRHSANHLTHCRKPTTQACTPLHAGLKHPASRHVHWSSFSR